VPTLSVPRQYQSTAITKQSAKNQPSTDEPTHTPSGSFGDGSGRGSITLSPVDNDDNMSSDEGMEDDRDTGISSVGDVGALDEDEPMLDAADLIDEPIPRNLMLTVDLPSPVPSNSIPDLDFSEKESFPCDKCDRSFKYAKSLKKHTKCPKCHETCIALSHKVCFDCKACVKNEDQFHIKCDKYKCDAPCFNSEHEYEEHTKTHGFEDF